jgi:hypothetical protein
MWRTECIEIDVGLPFVYLRKEGSKHTESGLAVDSTFAYPELEPLLLTYFDVGRGVVIRNWWFWWGRRVRSEYRILSCRGC